MSTPVSTASRIGSSLALLVVTAISLSSPAIGKDAPPLREVAKLRDPSGSGGRFGSAVAVSTNGRTAVIGARQDSSELSSAGAVHVYRRVHGEWVPEAKLLPPEPIVEGFFGVSVAVSADGRLALVGSSSHFANCDEPICGGAAYFFERDHQGEWNLIQALLSPDGGTSDAFGSGVALSASGRVAAIGASRANFSEGGTIGAVFVLERRDGVWQVQDRLTAQTPDPFVGNFGSGTSLSRSGRTVLIAAENAAYVFRREGRDWTEQAKLQQPGHGFGRGIALSGGGRIALVSMTGAAFVYTRDQSGWDTGQQLPTGPVGFEDVVVAISTTGKRALIGAQAAVGCTSPGSCIALLLEFRENAWTLQQTLRSSDSEGDNSFGDAVSLSATGRVALIGGAFQGCLSGLCDGAAYVFEAVRPHTPNSN